MTQEDFSLRVSVAFEPYPMPSIIFDWLEDEYGIATSVFDEFQLWHRPGVQSIWIASKNSHWEPGIKLETLGIQVTRRPPPKAKPSTYFAQRFGRFATRNVVDLKSEQIDPFFEGALIQTERVSDRSGYCIVRVGQVALGCGWLSKGQVRSNLPKYWSSEFPDGLPDGARLELGD